MASDQEGGGTLEKMGEHFVTMKWNLQRIYVYGICQVMRAIHIIVVHMILVYQRLGNKKQHIITQWSSREKSSLCFTSIDAEEVVQKRKNIGFNY